MVYKTVLMFLLLNVFLSMPAQSQETSLDTFFGPAKEYIFLQGIETKIDMAKEQKDVRSLTAYIALLFYAQHLSGKKNKKYDANELLREATLIAGEKRNLQELKSLEALWKSEIFGPNDLETAEAIKGYIEEINKVYIPPTISKETPPERPKETIIYNPQKLLLAEEYARLDAVSQIAESVFGVAIQSSTNVKDFVTQKDIVVSELKADLMLGAQFGEMQIHDREVHVVASLQREFILSTLRQSFIKRKQKVTRDDLNRLEKSLPKEYTATGIGVIDE